MIQWLMGTCACTWFLFSKVFNGSHSTKYILLGFILFQNSGVVASADLSSVWTVPTRLKSDNGQAHLKWVVEQGKAVDYFKITETFRGKTSVHYTEATDLYAWRIEPGEYSYVLQACKKDNAGLPDCGRPSEPLILEVTQAVTTTVLTQTTNETMQADSSESVNGGPDQLLPGHWFNPEKDGHGWSFYWSNRLALPQDDPIFGNNYDLVGVWYTYEAKAATAVPGCSTCPPATSAYRPVVVKLKAISIGPDSYGGSLYLSRSDGSELWIGSADVLFGSDTSSATVNWNASFKKESLSDSDPLIFLLGSDPADTSNISHFSGLWNQTGDDRYYVVTNIGSTAEVVVLVFHDDSGDPTWLQAVNFGSAVSSSSNFCLAYQSVGYSPQMATPSGWSKQWYMSGCDADLPVNSSNRNGRRYFSGLNTQHFWAEFTLPGSSYSSGSINIGSSDSTVSLEKAASFHGVVYHSAMGSSCELTESSPTCDVQLSWYTDGDYPDATVYAHKLSNDSYEKVLTSTQPTMTDVPYQVLNAGVYDFELRMGNGDQTTLIARSESFTVTEKINGSNPEIPPAPASPPVMTASAGSSRVGSTSGMFRVSESGSATYSIPILTAPASGGISPQISLNYNSQAGNGELGVGWALGGISVISLCPQTMEQDSISGSRGVRLDGEDRFCLDGQRLVVDSSSGEYGGNGTQYRTEIDSQVRVTSFGSAGTGPAWFKLENKDGSVVEYGNSTDSRIEARGSEMPASVFVWAQNRFEDRSGNYILYSYLENGFGPVAYVLKSIDYTGNERAGRLPSGRLSFEYGERNSSTDLSYSYFAGVQTEQRHLLQSIRSQGRVEAGSPLEDLRFYELTYEEDGVGRSILSALTECRSESGNICYQPTLFKWLKSESKINIPAIPQTDLLPRSNMSGLLIADVSGDGRPDILYTKSKSRRHFLYVKEATANASFKEWTTSYSLPKKSDGQAPRLFAIDINSDGIQDLAYSKYTKSTDDYTWVALLSNGSGFSSEIRLNPGHRFFLTGQDLESRIRVMDFNGDGMSDILHTQSNRSGNAWQLTVLLNNSVAGETPELSDPIELDVHSADLFPIDIPGGWEVNTEPPFFDWNVDTAHRFESFDARVFDSNGDGAVDLLLKARRNYQRCISNCSSQGASFNGDNAKRPKDEDPVYEVEIASFWILMESNGHNTFTRHSVVALGDDCSLEFLCNSSEYEGLHRSENVWPVDINNDGLADLAWGDPDNGWYYQINTGNGFESARLIGHVPDNITKLVRFEDWNGDGYPDLIYPSDTLNSQARWMVFQNHFGNAFAAVFNTQIVAGNVGGSIINSDPVENDANVFADFDGDGKRDQLFINSNTSGEILSSSIRKGINVNGSHAVEPANVISAISNGHGAVTEITYKPLTDSSVYSRTYNSVAANWGQGAAVYDYIEPVYVVSKVSGNTPTLEDPNFRNHTEYHYVGAKLQAGGRGLLGFAEIIVYDPQLKIRTNTLYRQDFPYTGLPVAKVRAGSAASSKFSPVTVVSSMSTLTWPELSPDTQPPASISGTLLTYSVKNWKASPVFGGSWRIYSNASLQRNYTLTGAFESKVLTRNVYDAYNNLTSSVVNTFDSDNTVAFSTRTTKNSWSATDTSNWNLGSMVNSTVTHGRNGKASVIRRSGFKHDSNTGLMLREIIEPGNALLEVVTTYAYDLFGNRKTTSKKGAGMVSRTSSVSHDPLGRFVISETNAQGQIFRKVRPGQWDVFGNPLEIENIDGIVSTSVIDLMGRPFASFNETGAWQKNFNSRGTGNACPVGTAWYAINTSGGGSISQQCFDINSRAVRSISKGLNGQLVYVDQYYDSSGRPNRISEPYFENDNRYWNETVYDKAGRITGVLRAGGDDISTQYDEHATGPCVTAGPRIVLSTNALGQRTTEVKNVLGETVESFDENCGQVSFNYDSMGYLVSVTGADGAIVSMSYDGAGRKISQSDPDKGDWHYAYNALGELTRQVDAKQQAIDFEYDLMGRVTNRRELSDVNGLDDLIFTTVNHETTVYRTSSPGKSQPARVSYQNGESGSIIHQNSLTYDWLGRVIGVSSTIGDEQFYQQTTFDAYGRVFQQFDASGDDRGLRYVYKNGHLSQLKEAREGRNGAIYQDILEIDARGNVTMAVLGNGVTAVAEYDSASGHLSNLSAYDQFGVAVQDIGYLFDVLGNLKSRHDLSGNNDLKENFNYDGLNRLKQVLLTAPALGIPAPIETLAVNYDAIGNITWKSDVGTYSYGSGVAGPHAVTRAGVKTYTYDLNGNQLSGGGRNIVYSVYDKALSLTSGDKTTTFTYGISNQRVKRVDSESGSQDKVTFYLGSVEYITEADGTAKFNRYLGGVAISTFFPVTGVQQFSYLLKDHIGSIHSVLNEEGLITGRMHFSPFGERQDIDWQSSLDSFLYAPLNLLTTRGFTGHEHVDSMGVIHMNGRIYDANLGRFLQADPFIQAPKNTQSLNRYSYVLNNPLSYTDPSGYFSLGSFIKQWGPTALAIVVSIYFPGAGGVLATQFGVNSAFAQFVITGFIAGGITGGIKGAVKGAFLAAVTYGVTQAFNQVAKGQVQLNEANLTPTKENLEHMLGTTDPASGLYQVDVRLDGTFDGVSAFSAENVHSGYTIFSNGMSNNIQDAVRNGTTQIAQIDGAASGYILNFNPTRTFGPDAFESARDITSSYFGFGQTELAENLAKVIDTASKNGVTGLRLIGHSQGAAITTSALRFAADSGLNLSAVGSVNLHGAPINDLWAKNSLANRTGISKGSIFTRAQFGDPVHNILGANFISNPLSLPFSAIRIPQTFSRDATLSPHTVPCFGGRMAMC